MPNAKEPVLTPATANRPVPVKLTDFVPAPVGIVSVPLAAPITVGVKVTL